MYCLTWPVAERCATRLQRSLGLSEAQRTEIIQLRRLFLTKMGNITKQRREIHETMMVRSCIAHVQCLALTWAMCVMATKPLLGILLPVSAQPCLRGEACMR